MLRLLLMAGLGFRLSFSLNNEGAPKPFLLACFSLMLRLLLMAGFGSDAVSVLGKVLRVAGPAHGPDPPGPRVRVLRLVLGRCPSVPPPAGRAGPRSAPAGHKGPASIGGPL